ncbi:MAG: hypothetical protein OXR84_17065 [Magnetovibrio sp.]|nr:hypothetical protein [Magnetovibrio sp.]
MTHQTDTQAPILSPEAIDAHIREARALRSRAFRSALRGAARSLTGWTRAGAVNHRFETMPDHLLTDLGISRSPAADLLAGARNDNVPDGGQAAA